MWMYLGLIAAVFLGIHNLCKKHAVQGNEVFPVLLITLVAGLSVMIPFAVGSYLYPSTLQASGFYIATVPLKTHGFIFLKGIIMASSWLLAYAALKHLPLSIVTSIRSAGPFFTFLGAIFIYHESPNSWQWIGFFMIILSVIIYSQIGKKEGIVFKRNKWFFAIVGATFLGASAGLYDKFLVQHLELTPLTLQFWFCFYTILILIVLLGSRMRKNVKPLNFVGQYQLSVFCYKRQITFILKHSKTLKL